MLRRLRIITVMGLALLLLPAIAYALDGKVDGKPVPELQVAVDTLWTCIAGILVFLMQAGFAMVEGGFTRAKNVANIMMKNVGDFSMAALGFWILGFGIMFGNGNAFLGTTGFFVSAGTGDLYPSLSWTSVPTLTAWFFQLMFCATAATIVAGAMAERTRFLSYLIFSFLISL
ncbi:MAG: ammonium transporter, partial [Deltaproteobacteria bacterium]|nr:ammonium transporter [Deltaproteobacteria bacterium]